jgi:hypothetical protein
VLVLRQILRDAERLGDGRRVDVADRETADDVGGREIALLQRRRHAEHLSDVVESVGRVVRRQQRGDVDVEREEIANRVRVFRAVQTMEDWTAGTRVQSGSAIELGFNRRRQRTIRRLVGLRRAGRRHRARPQLAHDALPDRGVLGDGGHVDIVEEDAGGGRRCPGALIVAARAVRVEDAAVRLCRRLRSRDGRDRDPRACRQQPPPTRHGFRPSAGSGTPPRFVNLNEYISGPQRVWGSLHASHRQRRGSA